MDPTRLTLRQWYEQRFAALYHADASPRTHAEYSATLNVWAALTADPPLAEITTFTLAAFRQAAKDTDAPHREGPG